MAVQIPYELSDHPQLVGIVRFPYCEVITEKVVVPLVIKNSNTGRYQSQRQQVDMAVKITSSTVTSEAITVPKTSVTDFYPYTYYVLTDGEVEPLIMLPQYLPSSFTIKGRYALSHSPIERYFPSSYKGDSTGNIYNITNTSQMMLPTSSNEGVSYMNANANSMLTERQNRQIQNVIGGIGMVGSALMGNSNGFLGGAMTLGNGLMSLKESDSRLKDIQMTPNSISSYGTPSTRKSFGSDVVRVLKYSVSENVKNKIISFTHRYGNKYNNYTTIDIRTYKGYLKMIEPKIISDLDINVIEKISAIFERGVYVE